MLTYTNTYIKQKFIKNITTYCLMGGLGFSLLPLIAGFVPQGVGFEVRRKISDTVLHAQEKPLPIINNNSWSLRAAVNRRFLTSYTQDSDNTFVTNAGAQNTQWLNFSPEAVHFAANVEHKSSSILSLQGQMFTGILSHGEPLTTEGNPLRWAKLENVNIFPAVHKLCTASRPSIALLQKTLDQRVFIPRNGESLIARAKRFDHLVENAAKRFNLRKDLLFAIIQTESDFSPNLVSSQSAMGLMQLLPSTAGGEVHRFLHGTTTTMTLEDLSNPELNILYGSAYFHLLLTRHFGGVNNAQSREYCAMAAYNMGPGRLMRFFGQSNEEAIAAINTLSAAELYTRLTTVLPIRETRNYVARVTHRQALYKDLL